MVVDDVVALPRPQHHRDQVVADELAQLEGLLLAQALALLIDLAHAHRDLGWTQRFDRHRLENRLTHMQHDGVLPGSALLGFVVWPDPMDCVFDGPPEYQHGEDQRHTQEQDAPVAGTACRAEAGTEPRAGGRGQAVDLTVLLAADDHAGTEEADSGNEALHDAADGARFPG